MGNAELTLLVKAKDQASSVLGGIGKAVIGLGVIAIAAAADMAKAAAEEQIGMKQVEVAARNAGVAWDKLGAATERQITAWQDASGVADTAIRPAFALLIAQTGSLEEATRRMPIALDLARGANIDLSSASRLLGKLTEENVNVFKRMGLTFDKNATELEVLTAVQDKFKGQSAGFASIAAGQWDILTHKIQDFTEEVGATLLPMVTTAIGVIGEMFGVITGKAPEAGGKLREAVGGPMAENIMGALAMVRDTAKLIFTGDFPALIDKVIAFVGEAVPKINAQLLKWGHEFIAWVGPQIPVLIGELFKMLGTALAWVNEHKTEIQAELKQWGALFGEFVVEVAIPALGAALPGIVGLLLEFAATVPGLIQGAFMAMGRGIVESIGSGIRDAWNGIAESFRYMLTQAIHAIDFWVGPFHISGISGITVSMPQIQLPTFNLPSFSGGGVVPGALGAPMLATVHGGEHIYDPRSGGGGSGGGVTVNVTVQGSVWSSGELAEQIQSAVRDTVLRGGFRGVIA